jgi:hypothetical protein
LASVLGCQREAPRPGQATTQATELPEVAAIDVSTPDKALKSYWAVNDIERQRLQGVHREHHAKVEAVRAQRKDVMTGTLVASLKVREYPLETFTRDIIEVKVESESRAVIVTLLKNTTPVPPGAEVSDFSQRYRTNGERFKYILEKDQSGWKVAEVWEWEAFQNAGWKKMAIRIAV